MADKEGKSVASEKSFAELEKDIIKDYNLKLKRDLDRQTRLFRHYDWRGNTLPPFSIEHMPFERQRLSGSGMTAEDRMLRKQWLQDQVLSPNEPKYIPELYPKNPIRQILAKPWDVLCDALKPALGKYYASACRYYFPRVAMGFGLAFACWYHFKYHPNIWEHRKGWHMYRNREHITPDDPRWPHPPTKNYNEFHDKGFMNRKVLLDLDKSTSAPPIN